MHSLRSTALSNDILAATRLPERSLLVALSISEWTGRCRDRAVTDKVARDHGAAKKVGCYTKTLVPKSYLAGIASVRTEARVLHHKLTLPWFDDGLRILPVDLHLSYMEKLGKLRSRFDTAVSTFVASYDAAKAAAVRELGTLYHADDYPSVADLNSAFSFVVRPQPLPTGEDWRVDLPAATVQGIRRELEAQLVEAQRLGLADLYQRLACVVSRMATTLGEPGKIFRDSLVGNVRDLCRLLPALNLSRDPGLSSLAHSIEERLASLDPNVLRTNPAVRQSAAIDAAAHFETITARLASYTGLTGVNT
jgi:hypothetical protein